MTGKDEAKILASDGVLLGSVGNIADSFEYQGMRFTKDGITFKASQIRRGLSFAGIMSKLNSNVEKEQQRTINSHTHQIQTEQPRQETYSKQQEHNDSSISLPSLGLFDTTNPVYDPAEEEFLLWQATSSITADGCNGRKRSVGRSYSKNGFKYA